MTWQTETKTGCRVTLAGRPDLVGLLGEGTMLSLRMRQAGDDRYAEVYLDTDAAIALHAALDDWIMRRG